MTVKVGDPIPEWVMESVSPERMRTMAALLRDPNPIHWDRNAVDALPLGLGKRTINQGPLGLSYMVNMLHDWAGPGCIQRIVMTFPKAYLVLDNDQVIARGVITAVYEKDGLPMADCDIWLEKEEQGKLLEGTATVYLKGSSIHCL